MAQAVFELFKADGSLQIDLATFTCKRLGQVSVGLAAGSVSDARFGSGQPWWYFSPTDTDTRSMMPAINESGGGASLTLSWNARSSGRSGILVYGIF